MDRTAQIHDLGSAAGKSAKGLSYLPEVVGGALSPLMGPMGPIFGSLISAGLNFGLNRIETGLQNRYNSPKSVMHRLSQAGMPGAAYFSGGGNQSAHSSQSYVSPDMGTTEAISREQVNRMQKQQFELMQREMKLKEQDLQYRTAQERKVIADAVEQEIQNRYFGQQGVGGSKFGEMIETKNQLANAQRFYVDKKALFQDMQNEVYKALKDKGIQVAKEEAGLKVLEEKPNFMKMQEALMSQQVQESISRIAKNAVAIEAMRKQMSVAAQTIEIRNLELMLNNQMMEDLSSGTYSGGLSAWLGAMVKKLSK